MAAVMNSVLKYFSTSINPSPKPQLSRLCKSYTNATRFTNQCHVTRLSYANPNKSFNMKDFRFLGSLASTHLRAPRIESFVDIQYFKTKSIRVHSSTLSHLHFRSRSPFILMSLMLNNLAHSLSFSSKADKSGVVGTSNGGDGGTALLDKVKGAWDNAVDATTYTGQKTKEAYESLTPHLLQLLDTNTYLKDVVVPVSSTLVATLLAWIVMPRLLRRFHMYSVQAPASLLSVNLFKEQVPYEKSFWGALEDPVRYMVTFMTFTKCKCAMMVAPRSIASQYLTEAWRGAAIMSFIWFLHRWKTNILARVLASNGSVRTDREKMVTLDTVSSVGLFVIGVMALAEACGVAVQSILTVGGIGGVATAFAAKDLLGNVLSGLSMQFSRPFSLGDTIKAGSVEGQVIEMGLTSTHLLSIERFPVVVPNSLFSSQVIVNKSRAQWRAMVSKIPVNGADLDKIPKILNDIKIMLRSHPKVFLGKEVPYCYLSQIESSFAELTVAYNLNQMSKDELYSAQQDILLQSVRIIKECGATLGSSWQDSTSP